MASKRSTQKRPAIETMSGGQTRGGRGDGAPGSEAAVRGGGGGTGGKGSETSSGEKSRASEVPPNQRRAPSRAQMGSPTMHEPSAASGTSTNVSGAGPGTERGIGRP